MAPFFIVLNASVANNKQFDFFFCLCCLKACLMVVKNPLQFLFDLSHNLQSINFDYLLSFLSKIISNLSTTTYITIIILVLFTFFFKVLIKKSHQTKQKTATTY